ncbi:MULTISPECIES: hypothetical protein [unclassified Flavobacterium]|uniref:hypothetical protein n=1 Tax=unclassified Flavobacterium TaxID=196869 RepID=UPI0023522EC2|nr:MULTISPECIES: hypothetical protein [unclassified Flavobacterium]
MLHLRLVSSLFGRILPEAGQAFRCIFCSLRETKGCRCNPLRIQSAAYTLRLVIIHHGPTYKGSEIIGKYNLKLNSYKRLIFKSAPFLLLTVKITAA